MSVKTSTIPDEFKTLSPDDRIEYVQGLWDYIAQIPDQVPIPESHKQVLDRRLAAYQTKPDLAKPWDQTRDHILKNLRTK
jgi:putative addiction module component (TIGR02574 family)